jgi:glycosyltransferase involved in cell wall biosynthesis
VEIERIKVAIVYDRVNKWGGAERVLLALHQIFPKADLFTSVYNPKTASWAKVFPNVYTSFLQKIPFAKSFHRGLPWLMPLAFESLNFDGYDLVISLTSEAAKGIITKPKTKHLCYLLTPTRYLWSHYDDYFKNGVLRFLSKPFVSYLRHWDKIAAFRPDKIVSISQEVRRRVKKYYGLLSDVIYPPIYFGNNNFKTTVGLSLGFDPQDYYLVVSRLEPYKKVDLVVETFNQLGERLVIVGVGSQFSLLKRKAKSNIKFLGKVNDATLAFYYQNAKALIMPQYEDFGLVSLEAQSYFLPVIAYRKGGACETVLEDKTGIFFDKQEVFSLVDAIERFAKMKFSRDNFKINLQRFSFDKFRELLLSEILELLEK